MNHKAIKRYYNKNIVMALLFVFLSLFSCARPKEAEPQEVQAEEPDSTAAQLDGDGLEEPDGDSVIADGGGHAIDGGSINGIAGGGVDGETPPPEAALTGSPPAQAAPPEASASVAGEENPDPARRVETLSIVASVPEQLRRPTAAEAPRYPEDMVIGELGRGSAGSDVYRFAKRTMNALISKEMREGALDVFGKGYSEQITGVLEEVNPRLYRIGGGREEEDGSVSFLIRFIGREKNSAGEIFFRLMEGKWTLEDIILEITEEEKMNNFNFPSYERFL